MKKDFQGAIVLMALVTLTIVLSACAGQKTIGNALQKDGSDACTAAARSDQYMVRFEDGHYAVVKAASEQDFVDNYLRKNLAQVKYAEPDYRVRAAMVRNSNKVTPSSADADNWGVMKVAPDALWQQNIRGQGVIVAVVDSGMDFTHPQLAPQVLVNSGEKPNNHIDDEGNGFIDDVYGWYFGTAKQGPLTGDNTFHGTHVSGIIAAAHNDSQSGPQSYVQGIAPGAKILPVAFLDENGEGDMSDGVAAIKYAVSRGAKVINASWGGSQCSRTLQEEIAALESHGVMIVVASGNESQNVDLTPEYPASLNLASQITVGATTEDDLMAEFSNYGRKNVHIFAPGQSIVSTLPGGQIGGVSGTSMATPFVTGAVALLLSAEPTATATQIRQALYAASTKRNDYVNVSQGRLNLATALTELRNQMGK